HRVEQCTGRPALSGFRGSPAEGLEAPMAAFVPDASVVETPPAIARVAPTLRTCASPWAAAVPLVAEIDPAAARVAPEAASAALEVADSLAAPPPPPPH